MKKNYVSKFLFIFCMQFAFSAMAVSLRCETVFNMDFAALRSYKQLLSLSQSSQLPLSVQSSLATALTQSESSVKAILKNKASLDSRWLWRRVLGQSRFRLNIPMDLQNESQLIKAAIDLSADGRVLQNRTRWFRMPSFRYNERLQYAYDVALTKLTANPELVSKLWTRWIFVFSMHRMPLTAAMNQAFHQNDLQQLRKLVERKAIFASGTAEFLKYSQWISEIAIATTTASAVYAFMTLQTSQSYFNSKSTFQTPLSQHDTVIIQKLVKQSLQKSDLEVQDWIFEKSWQDRDIQEYIKSLKDENP